MDNKLIIWVSVIGAALLAALISFFNTLFKLPLVNKDKISKIEVKLEYAMQAIEKEQEMNKSSHTEIIRKLDNLQKTISKLSERIAKQEAKDK